MHNLDLEQILKPGIGGVAARHADPYRDFLGLDPADLDRVRTALPADLLDAEPLADALFDRLLATAPMRQLLAEGHWDGRMPQLERGRFGAFLGQTDPRGATKCLREAGHELRRSGLAPGWILAGYGHHLGALFAALGRDAGAAQLAESARILVQTALADAGEVLDAYVESHAERVAQAERQLSDLFEAMPAGMLVLDADLRVLRSNVGFQRLFGWVIPKEVLGRGIGEVTRIADLPGLVDAALDSGHQVRDQMLFRQGEDGRRAYTCDIEPMAGEGRAKVLVMLRDVTERFVQREAAERLQAAVDLSHDAMFLVDPRSLRYLAVNATACQVLGYPRKELLALGPQDLLRGASLGELEAGFARLRESGAGGEVFVTELLRRDGRGVAVEIAQRAIRVAERDLVVVAARDLRDRRLAEARLQASEELYRETFEYAAVGVAHVASDGRWLRVNERLCEIVGYRREELLTKTFQDITHPEDLEADLDRVAAMLRGEIPRYSMEKRYLRKNGEVVWILLTVALVHDEHGAPRHFIAVIEDIQERKLVQEQNRAMLIDLEQRVVERTAALEAANRDLEAFSYTVSHDLRTPLRSISGFATALDARYSSALDEVGVGYMKRIGASVARMDQLIEDLLGLAKAGNTVVKREAVDLGALATEILDGLAATVPQRRVFWNIGKLPPLKADSGLLRIALQNLLGNAWKFTAAKAVAHISVEAEERSGETILMVRDNGVGFPVEQAARLFRPFQRLHQADEYPGSGIGLATVARIIERHGGRIWAEAVPGEGACFRFTLGRQALAGTCRE